MIDLQKKQISSQKGHRAPATLWQRSITVTVIGCIAAYFCAFAILNIFGFKLFCDSDMYADTLIAKLMWEQKTIFPQGWNFSSQYFVVGTPVFAALFYGITGDVNSAMVLATGLMSIFLLLSLGYMLRAVTEDRLLQLVCCLLFISSVIPMYGPKSYNAQLFFLQASYYACYLITMFVVDGDYIRSFQGSQRRPLAWALALYLSFATGIHSLRQTVVMVLPILACEIFQALRRCLLHEKLWGQEHRGHLIRALSYAAANVAGLITIKLLDIPQSILYGKTQLTPWRELWHRTIPVWESFRVITGLDLVGTRGVPAFDSVFVVFLIAVFVIASLLWLLRIKKPETSLELCWLLFLVGLIGVSLSSIVLNVKTREIYMFMWYPLVALSVILILGKLKGWGRQALILAVCLLSLGNLFHNYRYWTDTALLHDTSYAGRAFRLARDYEYYKTYAEVDEKYEDARQMSQWAMEQGYEYVYGDWYASPRIATHSGGKLIAGFWWQEDIFEVLGYNTSLEIFDEDDNAKAIYVLTADDEEACLQKAAQQGVTMKKLAEFGYYRAYSSPVQLMHLELP